jgi:hypothetical protein
MNNQQQQQQQQQQKQHLSVLETERVHISAAIFSCKTHKWNGIFLNNFD